MKREREVPVVVVERSDGLSAFLWGLLLGAGAALLLAPFSGEETRRALRQRGRELWTAAEEKAAELQELLTDGYEQAKTRVEETIDERRQAFRDAADAGRAAVHSARDELERRLADARQSRTRARRTAAEEEPQT
jgi:gas vesicle protein